MKYIKIHYIYILVLIFGVEGILHAEDTQKSGLPQFDISTYSQQFFWLIINFLIIYLFLSFIVIPKFKNIKSSRRHRISNKIEQSITIRKEIEKIDQTTLQNELNLKAQQSLIRNEIMEKIKILQANKLKDLEDFKQKEQDNFNTNIEIKKNNLYTQMNQDSVAFSKLILNKLNLGALAEEIKPK